MKRVLVLVEGQTEETFVNTVLAPHLFTFETCPEATRICTRREQRKRVHRGGSISYSHVKRDLLTLLRSQATAVTTMIDYYALPDDFPGWGAAGGSDCYAHVAKLEEALARDIADPRFIPYLVLHEFEGLLFTVPEAISEVLLHDRGLAKLRAIATSARSPEEIDGGAQTHPSKRLLDVYPEYQKPLDGPRIAARVGLPAIRAACRHFNEWLTRLESL